MFFFLQGLKVLGQPLMSAFGFGSSDHALSIFAVSDVMQEKGSHVFFYSSPLELLPVWSVLPEVTLTLFQY